MSDRSLRTVVTDTFTAPRYVHHMVKIATGAVVLAAYWLAFRYVGPLTGAVAGSVTWLLTIRLAYALDHGGPLITPDMWCDLALHGMPVALVVSCWGDWRVGAGVGVVLIGLYLWSYPDASP